jgi:hypothetical protein
MRPTSLAFVKLSKAINLAGDAYDFAFKQITESGTAGVDSGPTITGVHAC